MSQAFAIWTTCIYLWQSLSCVHNVVLLVYITIQWSGDDGGPSSGGPRSGGPRVADYVGAVAEHENVSV